MRIIYLHQYFTTPSHAGGVRSYEFSRRLVERGVSVDMITSSAFLPIQKKVGEGLISRRQIDGIDVHIIHTSYSNDMPFLRRIFAFVAFTAIASFYVFKLKNRSLVLASSTPLTIGVPGLIAKYAHRIPMVFEVRDLWPDVPVAMGIIRNRILIRLLKKFEMMLYRKADKIIALSEGMIAELKGQSVQENKLVLVPNASDMTDFETALTENFEDPLKSYRTSPLTRICLYAGTLGLVNNIDYLVALAKQFRDQNLDVHILIIGSGSQRNKTNERIKKESLQSFISIVDPVPKKELIPYILAADACISTVQNIPALYNNSANKFFDALAAGRPIIINHGGWQAEVIQKNELGLVIDNNLSSSAKKLSNYLRNVNKVVIEKKIKAFARENYSRDLLFERLFQDAILSSIKVASIKRNR